jgi:hypothetical protein
MPWSSIQTKRIMQRGNDLSLAGRAALEPYPWAESRLTRCRIHLQLIEHPQAFYELVPFLDGLLAIHMGACMDIAMITPDDPPTPLSLVRSSAWEIELVTRRDKLSHGLAALAGLYGKSIWTFVSLSDEREDHNVTLLVRAPHW